MMVQSQNAGIIPFETRLEWFDRSMGVAEKATFTKPGEQARCCGVISTGDDQ